MLSSIDRIKRIKVDTAAGGTVALIAAVASKRILVLALDITLVSGTLKFADGVTDLTGAMTFTSKTLPLMEVNGSAIPWYLTSAGAAFNAIFSGAVQCSGEILYLQE